MWIILAGQIAYYNFGNEIVPKHIALRTLPAGMRSWPRLPSQVRRYSENLQRLTTLVVGSLPIVISGKPATKIAKNGKNT
jgi:hypothetical protein